MEKRRWMWAGLPLLAALALGLLAAMWQLTGAAAAAGESAGIEIDGFYQDWEEYPHTQMSPNGVTGALYLENGALYGHLSGLSAGDWLADGLTIRFNGEEGLTIHLSAAGERFGLEDGIYSLYLTAERGERAQSPAVYGENGARGYVSIAGGWVEQIEFEYPLESAASSLGVKQGALKTAACRVDGLGERWLTFAQASTGGVPGILLCCGLAGLLAASCGAMGRRRRG
ncbi:MAG: hypothetical protein LUB63_02670 [Oscillospiraceae bacterium]|nr:hypothetical protein [Oscillospiraceae bacterium]